MALSGALIRMTSLQRRRLAEDIQTYADLIERGFSRSDLEEEIRRREGEQSSPYIRSRLLASWRRAGRPDLDTIAAPDESQPTEQIQIHASEDGSRLEVNARGQDLVRNVAELIEAAEIDTSIWVPTGAPAVNTWTTSMMGPDGPIIVRNWQVKARFSRILAQNEYRPPRVQLVRAHALPETRSDGREVAVCIPDAQIGYRRDSRGRHVPVHDLRVLDLAVQLIAHLQPEHVVWLGDNLDAAEAGSYDTPAEMIDTARPALAELRYWLAQTRAAAPRAQIWVLEGNHEDRLRKLVQKHLSGFAHLQRPGEDRPAFSVEALLQAEDFGATYVGPYREAVIWLWDRVRISHGALVRSESGATVAAVAKKSRYSELFWHIHRVEVAHETYRGAGGVVVQRFIASPGCACRLAAGLVPGHKAEQNWQQGLGIISFDLEHQEESIVVPTIRRGVLHWAGRRWVGTDRVAEVEASTGWPMARDWLQEDE